MAREATLRLRLDATGARQGARQFEGALGDVRRSSGVAERSLSGLRNVALGLGAAFGTLRRALFGLPGLFAALGIGGVGLLSKNLIKAASDAEELEGKFRVVFRTVNEEAEAVADTIAGQVGRSVIDIKDSLAGFQDTFVPFGVARADALALSETLTRLSLDISSFYNRRQEDVIRDLQSALVGQTETVRKYGAVILESRVKQEALAQGFAATADEITELDKVLVRLGLILQDTQDAQGDLIRTQESFANRVRAAQGELKDFRVELGDFLIARIDAATLSLQGFLGQVGGVERVLNGVRRAVGVLSDSLDLFASAFRIVVIEVQREAAEIVFAFGEIDRAIRRAALRTAEIANLNLLPNTQQGRALQETVRSFTELRLGVLADESREAREELRRLQEEAGGLLEGLRAGLETDQLGLRGSLTELFEGIGAFLDDVARNAGTQAGEQFQAGFVDAAGRPRSFVPGRELFGPPAPAGGQLQAPDASIGAGPPGPLGLGSGILLPPGLLDGSLTRRHREFADQLRDVYRRLGEDIGFAIGDAFENLIFQGGKLKDALAAIFRDISRIVFRAFVTEQLAASLGGLLAGAKGLVFQGGQLVPMASGGIVSGPTLFGLAGGRTGIMGEAGPEAVLPLERGADGKLGVKTDGLGGGRSVVVNMTVTTPDANSFRRSRRQIAEDLRGIA